MKTLIQFVILAMLPCLLFGQSQTGNYDKEKYTQLIKEANDLYKAKENEKANRKCQEAVIIAGENAEIWVRFNAANAWAVAGDSDHAFEQLFIIAKSNEYKIINFILKDTSFPALRSDKRWNDLVNIIKENKAQAEAKLDKPLIAALAEILKNDQDDRLKWEASVKKFGWNSNEAKEAWKPQEEKDKENQTKVEKILDERGWLGSDIIGEDGNETLFLVIQHSDLETQKKYLPMMRDAVKKGNAKARSLALLEDRVALGLGQKQIYGSQIGTDKKTGEHYVLPLEDPMNVDKRRNAVGLQPLSEYVSYWDIKWNPEEFAQKQSESENASKPKDSQPSQ